jgi:hypothetical protein
VNLTPFFTPFFQVLYELASATPRDLGLMDTARSQSWPCRMVAYGKPPKGRKHRN